MNKSTEDTLLADLAQDKEMAEASAEALREGVARAYQAGVPSKRIATVLGVTPSRVRQIAGPRLHLSSVLPDDDELGLLEDPS